MLFLVVLYVGMALVLRAIGLENAQNSIKQAGVLAPILFILISAVSLIIAPLSGSSIFIIGGAVFGKETAFFLSWIASTLGCSLNFWISRKFGRRVAARLIGKTSLVELDRFMQRLKRQREILYMILLMPIAQDIVSYAVGLTNVKYTHFLIALVISGAGIVAAYIYLGTSLLETLI
nr:VTT domain-containing protein [Leptolyngbya sp. FACHB-36]